MASYFPEAGNLNGSNADMCSDVDGHGRLVAQAICLTLEIALRCRTFIILPATSKYWPPFWI